MHVIYEGDPTVNLLWKGPEMESRGECIKSINAQKKKKKNENHLIQIVQLVLIKVSKFYNKSLEKLTSKKKKRKVISDTDLYFEKYRFSRYTITPPRPLAMRSWISI